MKAFIALAAIFISLVCFPITCSAESFSVPSSSEILNDLGGDSLDENLTDNAEDFMDEHNISPEDPVNAVKMTPSDILEYIADVFRERFSAVPKLAGRLAAAVTVSAAATALSKGVTDKSVAAVYGITASLICVMIVMPSVGSCLENCFLTLDQGGHFMIAYAPVFAAVSAAGGGITSSALYSMAIIGAAQLAVELSKSIIQPLLSVMLALGIAEGVNPDFAMSGFTTCIKKFVTFAVSLTMTVFTALISLQSFAGTSADTVAAKAVKLAASNFIPIVGGAISDAYGTVKASFGILRSGVGIFGIIAVCVMVLPPLVEAAVFRMVLMLASAAASIFDCGPVKAFLSAADDVMSLIFSVLMSFSVMFVVSTAVVLSAGISLAGGG